MFFYVLVIFFVVIILLMFSKIKIDAENIRLSTEKADGRFLSADYKITIYIFFLGKVPILKTSINKEKLENIKIKEKLKRKLKKIDVADIKNSKPDKKTVKKLKKAKPQIERIKLIATIGTEDAVITSYIVAVVSSIMGVLLRKQFEHTYKNKFIITPVYINKNLLNLELDCIFTMKMIHIIYIIYILNKKRRDDKNVRTSNRRAYAYSYE